ncbi:EIN3-binding F-box protein 1-like [Primulina huaijiensis]|uniref:EIN3-binding F-box protein 1-like n=1 Tax=Primulina huaijiensis TaxID=1492673 RepID=UPI003CC73BF9
MSKVIDFSGGDDFCSRWFMHTNPKDSNLFFPLGRHVDVYFPRKRSRVSAPFIFSEEVRQQSSIEVLPDACLFEVFRRLSGGQERSSCACVSKRWLMLLSSIHRDEIIPAKSNLGPEEHDNTSISEKADEASKPKDKVEFVDSSVVKTVNKEEFEGTDSDGFLSRCLEGKKATDVRLASIAVGTGSRGGLGKLSIHGSSSTRGLTNLGLRAIAQCGVFHILANCGGKLKALALANCLGIWDINFVFPLTSICHSLRSLVIHNCPGFGDVGLAILGRMCPKLTQLELSGLQGITDAGLLPLVHSLESGLIKLNLSGSVNLTDNSVVAITKLHGETLELMNLDGCKYLTDVTLSEIAWNCSVLSELDVSKCGITDSGIVSLAGAEQRSLQMFSLAGCSFVSDKSLPFLGVLGKTLVGLNIQHCNGISSSGIDLLLEQLWRCDVLY